MVFINLKQTRDVLQRDLPRWTLSKSHTTKKSQSKIIIPEFKEIKEDTYISMNLKRLWMNYRSSRKCKYMTEWNDDQSGTEIQDSKTVSNEEIEILKKLQ